MGGGSCRTKIEVRCAEKTKRAERSEETEQAVKKSRANWTGRRNEMRGGAVERRTWKRREEMRRERG